MPQRGVKHMASCICHVVCAPMWHRLERLVRPPFPGTCARRAAAQPLRRTVQQALCLVLPKRTLRAAKNFHRTLSEAEPAGRILRRVAPGRSRGAAGLTADACTARARCKRCGQARRYRLPGTRQQQCGKQGLTPELSRAAKRHRLERLVRPPFPGTCARRTATQPLRRTEDGRAHV